MQHLTMMLADVATTQTSDTVLSAPAATLIGAFVVFIAAILSAILNWRYVGIASRYKAYLDAYKVAKETALITPADTAWALTILKRIDNDINTSHTQRFIRSSGHVLLWSFAAIALYGAVFVATAMFSYRSSGDAGARAVSSHLRAALEKVKNHERLQRPEIQQLRAELDAAHFADNNDRRIVNDGIKALENIVDLTERATPPSTRSVK